MTKINVGKEELHEDTGGGSNIAILMLPSSVNDSNGSTVWSNSTCRYVVLAGKKKLNV